MINHSSQFLYGSAIADFRRARNQADLKELLSRLSGEPNQLLSYEEVRQRLGLQTSVDRGLQEIGLSQIVGSVGRYTDFTRDFLPLRDANAERWARIKVAAEGMVGLPPIEVYKIGEVYFVKDGNHRVSVARQMGATHIQAYVIEVRTRVPITSDIELDDLILKAEYNQFLEQTHLDSLRPDADLSVTIPGQYEKLLKHIEVHRYYMGLDLQREIPYDEAVAHWYEFVYLPVVEVIRNQGILRHFPQRTETDLYLWIAEHRAQLEEQFGWNIKHEYAVDDLVEQFSSAPGNQFSRLLEALWTDQLDARPEGDQRREKALVASQNNRLFQEILVPLNGREDGWCALEQAVVLALREHAHLRGLHVASGETAGAAPDPESIQVHFNRRCQEMGVTGNLTIGNGEVVDQICQLARLTDLVVVNLTYPPAPQLLARLSSGFRNLINRCPRPLLATPQTVSSIQHALLAFDNSPKAREALFLAAYLAGQWQISLTVLTVVESGEAAQTIQAEARSYLDDRQIEANYIIENGVPGELILGASRANHCDLIIMGGYGRNPILEVVLGSSVDQVLRESRTPVLICR